MFGLIKRLRKKQLINTLSEVLINLSQSTTLHYDNVQKQIRDTKEDLLGLCLDNKDLQKENLFWYTGIQEFKKLHAKAVLEATKSVDELAEIDNQVKEAKKQKLAIEAEIATLTLERDAKFAEKFIGE